MLPVPEAEPEAVGDPSGTGTAAARTAAIVGILCLLTVGAGCTLNSVSPREAASTHAANSQKMRDVMARMDALATEQLPDQIDVYDRWRGVMNQVAQAAAEVESAAASLPATAPPSLSKAERRIFDEKAETLRRAAADLQQNAAAGNEDAIRTSRHRLGEACQSCHQRFRVGSPGHPWPAP